MELDFRIESPEQATRFPSHGWANNPQGVKLLWFPLKSLLLQIDSDRNRVGAKPRKVRGLEELSGLHESELAFIPKDGKPFGVDSAVEIVGGRPSTLPFYATLNELVLILGALHHLIGRLQAMSVPSREDEMIAAYNINREALVLIKCAFIWLRSLLDLFAFSTRFLLFDKADQAPEHFFELRKAIVHQSITRWKPLVDSGKLRSVFDAASAWADILRDPAGGHRGVRDSIIHASCRVLFSVSSTGSGPGTATAYLTGDRDSRELISYLRTALEGLCTLCAEIHALVDLRTAYVRNDVVFNFGTDEDLCGFWPKI